MARSARKNKDPVPSGPRFTAATRKAYEPLAQLIARYEGRLTEISINGPKDVWLVVAGEGYRRLSARESAFATKQFFEEVCHLMAANLGLQFSPGLPVLACRTPDDHRFHAIIGPMVDGGIAVSLRIKRFQETSWDDFHVPEEWREAIERAVGDGRAVLLSGATGAGKTTFQNMILKFIPPNDRIITIEDTREIDLSHKNKVHITLSRNDDGSLFTWREAIDSCLRLNPDSIVPGELSILNAFPILQAMDTGHESVITTMHANTPLDALRGFRRRIALSGAAITEVQDLYNFLADTVALIVQIVQERGGEDRERRVVAAVERPGDLIARAGGGGLTDDLTARDTAMRVAEAVNGRDGEDGDARVLARWRQVSGQRDTILDTEEKALLSPDEQTILVASRMGLFYPDHDPLACH